MSCILEICETGNDFTLQFQIIGDGGEGGGLNKRRGPTDKLNINKLGGDPNKRGRDLNNVLGQKWQPVITNFRCRKQLLIVEKHQHNFSCSLHVYIKQNRTFLIANLSNVNKSCSRNQTRLCIYLLVLLVPSH